MAKELTLFLIHESGRNDALRGRRLMKIIRELEAHRGGPEITALVESGYHETMGGQSVDSLTAESIRAEAEGRFEPNGTGFPPGARVLVDGRDEVIVRQFFPTGSTGHMFPHYIVSFIGGDRNVAISVKRIGVERARVKANGDGMHHEVYDGFANALWVSSWADAIEELVTDKKLKRYPWPPGGSIDAVAPAVPAGLAARVEALFEKKLGADARAIVEAAYEAARDEEHDAPRDAEEFGWQQGMHWLGHGTDITDAGIEIGKKLGHGEFHMDVRVDRTGAPGKASINYTNLPEAVIANRRGSKRRGSKRRR